MFVEMGTRLTLIALLVVTCGAAAADPRARETAAEEIARAVTTARLCAGVVRLDDAAVERHARSAGLSDMDFGPNGRAGTAWQRGVSDVQFQHEFQPRLFCDRARLGGAMLRPN